MGLSNSKVLTHMTNTSCVNDISLRFGVIGAGQKGNKDADLFAGYTYSNGEQIYPSLAINFSKGDMTHLKYIDEDDRLHFDGFKGAARTPSLVVEAFDPQINEQQAIVYRTQLAEAMEKKFQNVDHLFISAGAGGGFGTGFVSLVLGLIKEEFFPVPITLLLSLPIDDLTEMANAILLMKEINDFLKEQNKIFGPGELKPLGSVILTDNRKLYTNFSQKKDDRKNNTTLVSWKDDGNDVIISTIHEANVIPANFGSDNVTYDPSDFVKLMQLSGGFLSIHKTSLASPFGAEQLKLRMKNSIELGYFACDHNYETASMYGGFVLRPSDATVFKDVKTEQTIKKTISDFNPTAQGKYGDPIWDADYAVMYTMFSGMVLPNRVAEMTKEYDEKFEKQKQVKNVETEVDVKGAMEAVQNSSFNPYAKRGGNKFGGKSNSFGGGSVFSRTQTQESPAISDVKENEAKEENVTKKKFGSSTSQKASSNVWEQMIKNK